MNRQTEQTLKMYRDYGVDPGGFLTACLENDLRTAFGRAGPESWIEFPEIVEWMNRELFWGAWGNPKAVQAWMRGKQKQREAAEAFNEAMATHHKP